MNITKEDELQMVFDRYRDTGHDLAVIIDRQLSFANDTSLRYSERELRDMFEEYLELRRELHEETAKKLDTNLLYPHVKVLSI